MKKTAKVIDYSDRNHPTELEMIGGRVNFSEANITGGNWLNTTIKLNSADREFWIRGQHDILCGTMIRLFYNPGGLSQSAPAVVGAYEILSDNSTLALRRYRTKNCEFLEK